MRLDFLVDRNIVRAVPFAEGRHLEAFLVAERRCGFPRQWPRRPPGGRCRAQMPGFGNAANGAPAGAARRSQGARRVSPTRLTSDAPSGAPSPRFARGFGRRDDGLPGAAKNTGNETRPPSRPALAGPKLRRSEGWLQRTGAMMHANTIIPGRAKREPGIRIRVMCAYGFRICSFHSRAGNDTHDARCIDQNSRSA
jgi:hypothetical protein